MGYKDEFKMPVSAFKKSFHRLNEDDGDTETESDSSPSPALRRPEKRENREENSISRYSVPEWDGVELDLNYWEQLRPHPHAEQIVEFIYALYGMKPKEARTLYDKLTRIYRKMFKETDVDKQIKSATKLTRTISTSLCPDGTLQISGDDIKAFKIANKTLIENVIEHISNYNEDIPPWKVASHTTDFLQEWNRILNRVGGQFLKGYGIIHKEKLKMSHVHPLTCALKKINKCSKVPREIEVFKCDMFESVITKSYYCYWGMLTRCNGRDPSVWRRTVCA